MKVNVVIVEPSQIITAGIEALVKDSPRVNVSRHILVTDSIEEQLRTVQCDVLLVNPTLPITVSAIRAAVDAPVVALVYQYVDPAVLKAFDAVVDVSDTPAVIVKTLTGVAASHNEEESHDYNLTKREIAVLVLVAEGLRSKEIADQLNVSEHTVMTHRKNIMQKTGIKSTAGLTMYAMVNGLIDEGSIEKVFHSN